ncbi:signal transduction histidine kinase [Clostridium sp. CAG:269]|nr:signal transduction histidine kinase [Clostridium sp. CAG:269]
MKNKIELKKMCITSCIVIIIFLITFSILIYKQYKTYTYNFNQKIAGIIDNVLEKYPDIEKREIVEILNSSDKTNNEILREYGIELDKDSVILENNTDFQKFIIIDVSTLIVFILILSIIVFKYNHSESKKINEITKYIEEINRGNYKLNIEENTEDELSILKNELYKITIMLKEVAENSQKDKTTLKDSLSDISHQIKTPITSILIMLDNILSDENMPEDIKKDFIKDIKREIVNIKFLVESILKLSKIDSNSIKFIKKEVFIKDIINEAVKNVSMLSELKNIKIIVSGDDSIKTICDLKWQVEAITNILKNCIEHSYENKKIYINYNQNNMYTELKIEDNGTGIDAKDLPHIFERFYKGKNSSSDSVGIGLALSKSIIESNNGYIQVDSELNKGTIFIIKYLK